MTEKRVSRWYFGGLASCGAACCTHPLDLLKVGYSVDRPIRNVCGTHRTLPLWPGRGSRSGLVRMVIKRA